MNTTSEHKTLGPNLLGPFDRKVLITIAGLPGLAGTPGRLLDRCGYPQNDICQLIADQIGCGDFRDVYYSIKFLRGQGLINAAGVYRDAVAAYTGPKSEGVYNLVDILQCAAGTRERSNLRPIHLKPIEKTPATRILESAITAYQLRRDKHVGELSKNDILTSSKPLLDGLVALGNILSPLWSVSNPDYWVGVVEAAVDHFHSTVCDLARESFSRVDLMTIGNIVLTDMQMLASLYATCIEARTKESLDGSYIDTFAETVADNVARESDAQPQVEIVAEDREVSDASRLPKCSPAIIDGDYIGDLTRLLSDGTPIPPEFIRENIKTIMGSIVDDRVGFEGHEDLHMRMYTINVSLYPRTGKGASWKLTGDGDKGGVLCKLLASKNVQVVDGCVFGSGEKMVAKLSQLAANVQHENPDARADIIARFDEVAEPFEKAKAVGSTLESKFLQLYERTSAEQSSFKNGEHSVHKLHFSMSGDTTRDKFQTTFAGRGSVGSGFLSRCTYSFAERTPHIGDWAKPDMSRVWKTVAKIRECVEALPPAAVGCFLDEDPAPPNRIIPPETTAAKEMRLEFFRKLNEEDRKFTPELEAHFKRDLLMRAVFSGDMRINETMTNASILWTSYQLEARQLLWPEDGGSLVEMMEHRIQKALEQQGGQQMTSTQLQKFCNVRRLGSGGVEVFNRAIRSLILGGIIQSVGKTQRNQTIYALTT
jgi:hypothetical protein